MGIANQGSYIDPYRLAEKSDRKYYPRPISIDSRSHGGEKKESDNSESSGEQSQQARTTAKITGVSGEESIHRRIRQGAKENGEKVNLDKSIQGTEIERCRLYLSGFRFGQAPQEKQGKNHEDGGDLSSQSNIIENQWQNHGP